MTCFMVHGTQFWQDNSTENFCPAKRPRVRYSSTAALEKKTRAPNALITNKYFNNAVQLAIVHRFYFQLVSLDCDTVFNVLYIYRIIRVRVITLHFSFNVKRALCGDFVVSTNTSHLTFWRKAKMTGEVRTTATSGVIEEARRTQNDNVKNSGRQNVSTSSRSVQLPNSNRYGEGKSTTSKHPKYRPVLLSS